MDRTNLVNQDAHLARMSLTKQLYVTSAQLVGYLFATLSQGSHHFGLAPLILTAV